jgi:ABC-2 type transport system permease protein
MPIFDQGYQHWKGPLSGHAWRWFAVARQGVRIQLKGRIIRLLLLTAWLPAIALVAILALWGLAEQGNTTVLGLLGAIFGPTIMADPRACRATIWTLSYTFFFRTEMFCIMALVVVAGPNLISADLRFNALPLYFSRPLGRLDYFLGKLGVIAALVAAVAVVPAVLAYVLGACFSLDLSVVADTWHLLVASVIYGLAIVLSAGTLILALSSLSRRSLYVGIAWLGLWLIGSTLATALGGLERGLLFRSLLEEEVAKENRGPPPNQPGTGKNDDRQRDWQAWGQARGRAQRRFDEAWAEESKGDWTPLCSYTANLQRLGEELLGTDAAWVQLGRLANSPLQHIGKMGKMMQGGRMQIPEPTPANDRRLANQWAMQYPWWWSAGVLAGLLGISVCTLSGRVKSLDRLR